jgi:hypothetical protein
MSLAIGSITLVSVGSTTANLLAPAATGGSAPVTYQWYRSTASGFTPGTGTVVTGGTSLSLADSGLTPGTIYYYEIVATDAAAAKASSNQLTVTSTAASPNPNQFTLAPYLGMLDLRFNGDTISVQFDPAGSGTLVGGQAVLFSAPSTQGTGASGGLNGIPLVVPSTGSADSIAGMVNYDIKSAVFKPGDRLEISLAGNVMYLYAALPVTRGKSVTSLPSSQPGGTNGGVVQVTGSSGLPIVGWSLDTAAIGTLTRIMLQTPPAPYAHD